MKKKIWLVGLLVLAVAIAAGSIAAQNMGERNGEESVEENGCVDTENGVLEEEVNTLEGTFSGVADSHTVELKIDGEYQAFGLDKDVDFEGIEVGDEVKIEYGENENGRTVIKAVEKID